MENEEDIYLPQENETISAEDFTFVQKDETIHDKKFQTKPTTFFKDAMKRFAKSRSSVVAAGILAVLIGMAIVVPLADQNDIETPLAEARYLPPKWFDGDLGGFLDGTRVINNAPLDPATGGLPADSEYRSDAIVGNITPHSAYADALTDAVKKYGKGGDVKITNSNVEVEGAFAPKDAGLMSPELTIDLNKEGQSISFYIDAENMSLVADTDLTYFAAFVMKTASDVGDAYIVYPLTPEYHWSTDKLDVITVSDIAAELKKEDGFAEETSLKGYLAAVIGAPSDLRSAANSLLISKVESSFADIVWDDATKAMTNWSVTDQGARDKAGYETGYYTSFNQPLTSIYHSQILYGSFRYDAYQHAFGDKPGVTFSSNEIQSFIDKGWITYEWRLVPGDGMEAGAFTLTAEGEKYCPLRSVQAENYYKNSRTGAVRQEVVGTLSLYRRLASNGQIAKYEMPKYVFGTDYNGYDFLKLLFSGLLVSLGLGFLASGINIVIGLIWGAVSGYFGGTADFIMERFTEILGGVPFIIVMTLIVLLIGSSFGTFLLALCLTGWIGVAGVTRSQFYRYKRREYVLASRTLGASDARLIFKHILPNAVGTIVTSAVLMIPDVIFTEANIAYLLPGTMVLEN
ncbi:MAG: ABC transporter permease, partial [Bacilli bacterium]|nr:ABC transporter permease [Bacilli bacterium]